MNPSNWRTNFHAVAIGALMLLSIWAPATWQDKIQKTEMALVMTGFLTAADAANLKKQ